jgi:hypothetical protein
MRKKFLAIYKNKKNQNKQGTQNLKNLMRQKMNKCYN